MGIEIERKFLLADDSWRGEVERSVRMVQRYMPFNGELHATGRVRIAGDKAYITLKGAQKDGVRSEYEYPVPVSDALEMMECVCSGTAIEKTRHIIRRGKHVWEIDEFHGANTGLVLAEIELESPDEAFEKPSWLGIEVTGDWRYSNSSLSKKPFNGTGDA